jgi:cytochrome P450
VDAFPVESKDLLSPELTADPYEYFETLRRHDPVRRNGPAKGSLHTRYADISDAVFDPRLSSNRALPLLDSMTPERREVMAPMLQTISRWMVVNDPPAHTRLRKLSNAAFHQQRVVAMGEWIAEMVDDLLDEFIASGDNYLLDGFANQLPALTIGSGHDQRAGPRSVRRVRRPTDRRRDRRGVGADSARRPGDHHQPPHQRGGDADPASRAAGLVGGVDWAASFASRGVNAFPISHQGMRATVASCRRG